MKRPRLFEFEDLPWFPESLRDAGTDVLRFQWEISGAYKPIARRLSGVLSRTNSAELLDLGSGGGGPVLPVYRELLKAGYNVHITLSDRFPNLPAFKYISERTNGGVGFAEEPVDATDVPEHLPGLRTMFAALHHFEPERVRRILQDAVVRRRGIAVFDFSPPPTPPPPLFLLIGNPLGVALTSPFVKPFRWSRLFWTYVVPILPLFFVWDAQVSALHLYSVRKLREIWAGLPPNDYVWEIGQEPFPHSITYLIGYPG